MDFGTLTDDQLIELMRLAAQEAVARGEAVATAAKSAGLSEAEKVQIEQDEYVRELERIRAEEEARARARGRRRAEQEARQAEIDKEREANARLWRKKGELGQEVIDLLGHRYTLTVWKRGGDKRVYIDRAGRDRDSQWGVSKVSYFHSGGYKYPPGAIVVDWSKPRNVDKMSDEARRRMERFEQEGEDLFRTLVERACDEWNVLKDVDCDAAASYLQEEDSE